MPPMYPCSVRLEWLQETLAGGQGAPGCLALTQGQEPEGEGDNKGHMN